MAEKGDVLEPGALKNHRRRNQNQTKSSIMIYECEEDAVIQITIKIKQNQIS